MEISRHKRRIYLINKRLQLKYATLLVFTLSVVSIFVTVILYLGIWEFVAREFSELIISQKISTVERILAYEAARYAKEYPVYTDRNLMEEAKRLSQHEKDAVKAILKKVNIRLLPRLVIIFILIGIVSIFITHKIAGPLYRFRRNIRAISEGDLSVVFNLRRGDDLKELAGELGVMTKNLKGLMVRYGELAENLFAHTQSLSEAIKQLPIDERETLSSTLERIKTLSRDLKGLSNTLKTEKEKS